jgi:hypothetical protein
MFQAPLKDASFGVPDIHLFPLVTSNQALAITA